MARHIAVQPDGSLYRQQSRLASVLRNALQNPAPPAPVAEKILEIVESGTWQRPHPVGPDAVSFLQWRGKMTDEEWVGPTPVTMKRISSNSSVSLSAHP